MPTQQVKSYEQLADLSGGWILLSHGLNYLSSDSPSFVVTTPQNITGTIGLGMKLQLDHLSSTKNFFVTQVSLTGSTTYLNLYGGTDYTLNVTGAITNPKYSYQKSPYGFPTDPDKWTVSFSDTANVSQATPTNNTAYNLGSLSVDIPIGVWRITMRAFIEAVATLTATRLVGMQLSLSTANNAIMDSEMTWQITSTFGALSITFRFLGITMQKNLSLTSKTTHYLLGVVNVPTDNATTLAFRGDFHKTMVKAVCAYL